MILKKLLFCVSFLSALILIFFIFFFAGRAAYPRPYKKLVESFSLEPALVYSIMKAESSFQADAKSSAGAVGLMQLLPSTAEFVCAQYDLPFDSEKLTDGEYNVRLGCCYLLYLFERFPEEKTTLSAYNAGEGTVSSWLKDKKYSKDGKTLSKIPYPETERYLKKVEKFRKNYRFFYH